MSARGLEDGSATCKADVVRAWLGTIRRNGEGFPRVEACMEMQTHSEEHREGDEIADLARHYLLEPGIQGVERVDAHIDRAMADSRWDDMSMWHRVRLRLIRFQRERAMAQQLGCEPLF
ncbi:MAG: hypothetical protein ABW023_05630 [Sphingomonas sp.]